MSVRKLSCAIAALALVAACGGDDETLTSSNAALVQFVNASSTGSVTTSGGSTVGSDLGFQQASSSCMLVSPGTQSLGFVSAGASVASSSTTTLQAGQRYTVVLTGTGTARTSLVFPEMYSAQTSGNYGLRFINATSQTGSIYVTTPTGTVSGTANATLAAGAATGGTTGTNGFTAYPVANTRVRFFANGTTTNPLADYTVANPSSSTATTIVFANTATGGVTAFSIPQCTAP